MCLCGALKQCSRVSRPNWNAVQWPRVFGIDMTSRASRRRCPSGVRPEWWGRTENWHWTNRGISLRLAEKKTSWWGSYISPLYDLQRRLLQRRQTEQKTTNKKLPVCSPHIFIIIIIIIVIRQTYIQHNTGIINAKLKLCCCFYVLWRRYLMKIF